MTKPILSLFVLGLFFTIATAAEKAAPDSTLAKRAMAQFGHEKKEADAVYKHAIEQATQKLTAGLNAAKTAAMRSGDLPEANAIAAEIKKANDAVGTQMPDKGASDLTARLAGTKWKFQNSPENVFTYDDAGHVSAPGSKAPRSWRATNAHTIIQRDADQNMTITYDDDFQHAIAVYDRAGAAILIRAK
jgi:hypothetical protein